MDEKKHRLRDLLPGYDSEWNCSGPKKGYSGTAVFFPKQDEGWYGKGGAKGGSGDGGSTSDGPVSQREIVQSRGSVALLQYRAVSGRPSLPLISCGFASR